jgi:hypothetical protein
MQSFSHATSLSCNVSHVIDRTYTHTCTHTITHTHTHTHTTFSYLKRLHFVFRKMVVSRDTHTHTLSLSLSLSINHTHTGRAFDGQREGEGEEAGARDPTDFRSPTSLSCFSVAPCKFICGPSQALALCRPWLFTSRGSPFLVAHSSASALSAN